MDRVKNTLSILLILFLVSMVASSFFEGRNIGDIAVVKIRGVITVDRTPGYRIDYSSSNDITGFVKMISKTPQVKAVIFDINSPGGTPVATDEIVTAIKNLDKPTVAVIREVGASGAYWIASSCDKVYANRMSMTGSIGVIASYLDFSGLINRFNVTYERIVSSEYKDMGVPFRELTDDERAIFNQTIERIEYYFIEDVANNRNLPFGKVKQLANGQVYLGIEAKENGLIDELGGLDDARGFLMNNYNLTGEPVVYQSERGIFSGFLPEINSRLLDFGIRV